jgi:hypothetical protein
MATAPPEILPIVKKLCERNELDTQEFNELSFKIFGPCVNSGRFDFIKKAVGTTDNAEARDTAYCELASEFCRKDTWKKALKTIGDGISDAISNEKQLIAYLRASAWNALDDWLTSGTVYGALHQKTLVVLNAGFERLNA